MSDKAKGAGASLVLLAGVSAWLSYASVRTEAIEIFGDAGGSAFPVLLDAGVYTASEYYLISVRSHRPEHGFRALAHALIATTVALNVTAATGWKAALFHAVPPALFAALVELRARKELGDARATKDAPERISLRLWATAPIESFRLSLWVTRQGSYGAQRAARERQVTALQALRIALPSTKGDEGRPKIARSLVARLLKGGALDPRTLVEATGLDQTTSHPGAEAVLRVALLSALGAPEAHPQHVISTGHMAGTPVSEHLLLPPPRRTRAPQNPNPGRTPAELRDTALQLNQSTIASTGKPATLRALKRDLGIGQDRATELRDWLATQPIAMANGWRCPPGGSPQN
jgi:hypothetical protein